MILGGPISAIDFSWTGWHCGVAAGGVAVLEPADATMSGLLDARAFLAGAAGGRSGTGVEADQGCCGLEIGWCVPRL